MDNNIIEQCSMTYNSKHKLEYHLTYNKSDNKLARDQETEPHQSQTEYFQEVRRCSKHFLFTKMSA